MAASVFCVLCHQKHMDEPVRFCFHVRLCEPIDLESKASIKSVLLMVALDLLGLRMPVRTIDLYNRSVLWQVEVWLRHVEVRVVLQERYVCGLQRQAKDALQRRFFRARCADAWRACALAHRLLHYHDRMVWRPIQPNRP